MRILAIRGKDLASLAGEFEVDFRREPLASAGLFAITGPTGAGKSTLLDALCLALYDATPRMATAHGKGVKLPDVGGETIAPADPRNLLRRGAAHGYAQVEFVGNDGVDYRCGWSVRRAHARAAGKLQPAEMSLVRVNDGQPASGRLKTEVLAAVVALVGLSFEQFTRAVLLAQNEFSAFLKASEDERAALLQTLTGTDRFERISQRAFERDKAEQNILNQLIEQAANQPPLDPATRLHWESERQTRRMHVDAFDGRCKALDAHLTWYREHDLAFDELAQARRRLQAATEECTRQDTRRGALALLDAVQPARARLAEVLRLDRELDAQQTALDQADRSVQHAGQAQAQAEAARQRTAAALASNEHARDALAGALNEAKRLDTEIAALTPTHGQARRARDDASAALRDAREQIDATRERRARAAAMHDEAARWLQAHAHWGALAQRWPRWDTLFEQALGARGRVDEAAARLDACARARAQASDALGIAQARHDERSSALRAATTHLQAREHALAQYDVDTLVARKDAADQRLERAQSLLAAWREYAAQRESLAQSDAEAARLAAAMRQCEGARDAARQALPAALEARAQAQRSWRIAYDACQANVQTLRQTLQPDMPCPVCGAAEHPYVDADAPVQRVVQALQDEDRQRRADVAALERTESTQAALLLAHEQSLGQARARSVIRRAGLDAVRRRWREASGAAALSHGASNSGNPPTTATVDEADAVPRPDLDVDVEAAELEVQVDWARAEQQALADALAHARDATKQCVAARETCAGVRVDHAAARDALHEARSAASQNDERLADAQAAHAAAHREVGARLDDLDEACAGVPTAEDWREAWRSDPQAYRDAQHARAEQWHSRMQALDGTRQTIAQLDAALVSGERTLASHAKRDADATAHFAAADESLAGRRQRRAALFDSTRYAGLETIRIETMVAQEVDTARRLDEEQRQALSRATQESARLNGARDDAQRRVASLRDEAGRAGQALAAWLRAFNTARAPAEPIDAIALRRLLDHDPAWLADERLALQALDDTLSRARGVLAERERDARLRESTRPNGDTAEQVRAARAAATEGREAAARAETEAALVLAQDDARRRDGDVLARRRQAQEATTRTWRQLNELIGSADGKKFRNHAQQLTLDVLLSHANLHLRQLARRYRLERVERSLALLVVDQDMADEARSVHSLSGGESFLVSLALALGLASLSSHRVRVESLFIDEGFGSLDGDTLRVAMDALDTLQAQGRKVGVISHVQDMTERIATRIEVRRLSGGRSRLVVDG